MPQAYEREFIPREWYIKFSRPNEYSEIREKYWNRNIAESPPEEAISCPNCGNSKIIEGLRYTECGKYIPVGFASIKAMAETEKGNTLRKDLESLGGGLEKLKEDSNLKKTIGWLIVVILVVGLLFKMASNNNDSATNKNHSEATSFFTNKGFYYAISKDAMDRMDDYIFAKDGAAFNALIQDGEIVMLPEGLEVYLESSHLSYSVIRPRGETYKLWCATEAISKK